MSKNTVAIRAAGESTKALPRRFNFTVAALQGTPPPAKGKLAWVYDNKAPGLAMLTTPAGARTFYLYKKIAGRPQRIRIGGFPEISIDQARRMAAQLNGQIAEGRNPQAEKQQARAEMTFAEVFKWYMDSHSKLHNRTAREDQAKYDKHLHIFGSRRFTDLTRADVAKLHTKIGENAPGAANRVLALLSSIYNKAHANLGLEAANPAKGIQRFKENQRERFLQADELARFFDALKEQDQDWQDFFTVAIFTGARRSNLLSMEWPEVNLSAAIWSIPAAKFKTNRPMVIPLDDEVVKILKRRYADRTPPADGKPDYVFKSYGRTGHLTEYKVAWKKICEAAVLKDLRPHDLRRTQGSWQAATGASLAVIGKSLGHTQQQTTAIYARLNLEPVRKSMTAGNDAMRAAIKAAKKGK